MLGSDAQDFVDGDRICKDDLSIQRLNKHLIHVISKYFLSALSVVHVLHNRIQ